MFVLTNNDRMGKNILYLRQKCNLSQDAFAELIGMNENTLDAIERGMQYEIDAQAINTLCRLFGTDIYHLSEALLNRQQAD